MRGSIAALALGDPNDAVVARQRARLDGALLLAVAAGADHALQLAAPGLSQRLVGPSLSGGLGEVAGAAPAALGPCRTMLLRDLTAVREPVLGVPDRAARHSALKTWPPTDSIP